MTLIHSLTMLVHQSRPLRVVLDRIRYRRGRRAHRDRSGENEETFMHHNSQPETKPEKQRHTGRIEAACNFLFYFHRPSFGQSFLL